jgi:signal transduction histidine kinase
VDGLSAFFDSSRFMPHGHCYLWTPSLLWSNVVSDLIIAGSYFSIPVALWYFARKRPDLPFRWIFVMFGIFVMACGTTHVLAVWTIWKPDYWIDAAVKVLTAAASVPTAILLWPLIPRALALPSPATLRQKNRELEEEIARRRKAEADLLEANLALQQHSAELEVANRELEAFNAAASHDLRAPLRQINSNASLILMEAGDLGEPHTGRLRAINQATVKMGNLIDALLSLSRTNRPQNLGQAVDLNQLIDEIRGEQSKGARAGAIDWRQGTLPVVRGDAALLLIALTNLISNAVKFSRGREQPRIEIDTLDTGAEQATMVIKDNGAGFDPGQKDRLFGVFQRLHRDDEFEGTGIGLATVRRIVERHGGRIWAEATQGSGASFYFTLPLASR